MAKSVIVDETENQLTTNEMDIKCHNVGDPAEVYPLVKDTRLHADIMEKYPKMASRKTKSPVLSKQSPGVLVMDNYKPAAKIVAIKGSKTNMAFWLHTAVRATTNTICQNLLMLK